MPMNNADKNVKMYACIKATNSSSKLNATNPSTLAGVTAYQVDARRAGGDERQDHRQHQVPGHHVGQKTHGQDEVLDAQPQAAR